MKVECFSYMDMEEQEKHLLGNSRVKCYCPANT